MSIIAQIFSRFTPGKATTICPPVAKQVPRTLTLHGAVLTDEYHWLRDIDTDGDVIDLLEQENDYTDSVMAPHARLVSRIAEEIDSHYYKSGQQIMQGASQIYEKTDASEGHPCFFRRHKNGKEELLLDTNELVGESGFLHVGDIELSPCGTFLAFTVDHKGFRQYELYVRNLKTRLTSAAIALRVTSLAWCKDNRTLFFTEEDPVTKRSSCLNALNVVSKRIREIYRESDPSFSLTLSESDLGKRLFLYCESNETTQVFHFSKGDPEARLHPVTERKSGVKYTAEHYGPEFFLLTNDGAPNYQVVRVSRDSQLSSQTTVLVSGSNNICIREMRVFCNFVVLLETHLGMNKIRVIHLRTGKETYIPLPEGPLNVDILSQQMPKSQEVQFVVQSPVMPERRYIYHMKRRELRLDKAVLVNNYTAKHYDLLTTHAMSPDGTMVPITLVFKKPFRQGKPRPLWLYGYGAYGFDEHHCFNSTRLSLLNRGVIFAIAHVRGGSEIGEHWYQDGKMGKKMNSFLDFIACADHLVAKGYTTRNQMVLEGHSAGGMLVATTFNLRRDIAAAGIIGVPFVDMVNTLLDEDLPLTVDEFKEWGNPKVEAQFRDIIAYSPYDNIKAQDYPALFVTGAVHDSQVRFWEPAKYVSRLRARKTGDNPVLLRTLIESGGHDGPSSAEENIYETALQYAFCLSRIGIRR